MFPQTLNKYTNTLQLDKEEAMHVLYTKEKMAHCLALHSESYCN